MQNLLTGQTAIITGATSGIGRATARLFAQEGAHIVACGRRAEALASLSEEIRALGNEIAHVHVFAWTEGNVRHPLSQGEKPWKEYLAALKQTGTTPRLILEFVKDDSETAFFQDAATLRRWAAGTKGEGDAT